MGAGKENAAVPAAGDGGATVVLGMDLHCEGCAMKVARAAKKVPGVEKVVGDVAGRRVTVTGAVDPWALKETIERKTKKSVVLISPANPPKKEAPPPPPAEPVKKDIADGEKPKPAPPPPAAPAADEGKKPKGDDVKKPKEAAPAPDVTVNLRIQLHCSDCEKKVFRRTMKIKGVKTVKTDAETDLVVVTGTVDPDALRDALSEKLGRKVEIVGTSGGNDKKSDAPKDNGEEKKKSGGGGGDAPKSKEMPAEAVAQQQSHYYNYGGQPASTSYYTQPQEYRVEHGGVPSTSYYSHPYEFFGGGPTTSYYDHPPAQYGYYAGDHAAPAPQQQQHPYYGFPAEMALSDENPNGCSVM